MAGRLSSRTRRAAAAALHTSPLPSSHPATERASERGRQPAPRRQHARPARAACLRAVPRTAPPRISVFPPLLTHVPVRQQSPRVGQYLSSCSTRVQVGPAGRISYSHTRHTGYAAGIARRPPRCGPQPPWALRAGRSPRRTPSTCCAPSPGEHWRRAAVARVLACRTRV